MAISRPLKPFRWISPKEWGEREAAWAWRLAGALLSVVVLCSLPGRDIRLGASQLQGLVGIYLYARRTQLQPIPGFHVSEVYLPKTIRLQWGSGQAGEAFFDATYHLTRKDADTGVVLATFLTKDQFYNDVFAFDYGKAYQYEVYASSDKEAQYGTLPEAPLGADPDDIVDIWTPSPEVTLRVMVQKADVDADQTVDSRYDLRYGNPTALDFKFGGRAYRGGLFAGYAQDPSRVGRSFLKWDPLPSLPSNAYFWTGSVNAFHTRSWVPGSTVVGCQSVTTSWTATDLKWTNAPALTPSAADARFTVNWDPNSTPSATTDWAHWTLEPEIHSAITGSGLFATGLASVSESSAGWVYFAKKAWEAETAPCVLYAYEPSGYPSIPTGLTATVHASPDEVELNWTNGSTAGHHLRIERKVSGGSYSLLAEVSPTASSYFDDTVDPATTYVYRVGVFKAPRVVGHSNEATAVIP